MSKHPFSNFLCRVPDYHSPGGHIFHCNRTRADDGAFADCHPGSDKCIGADPCVISDVDRWLEEAHRRISVIMGPGTQMGTL